MCEGFQTKIHAALLTYHRSKIGFSGALIMFDTDDFASVSSERRNIKIDSLKFDLTELKCQGKVTLSQKQGSSVLIRRPCLSSLFVTRFELLSSGSLPGPWHKVT